MGVEWPRHHRSLRQYRQALCPVESYPLFTVDRASELGYARNMNTQNIKKTIEELKENFVTAEDCDCLSGFFHDCDEWAEEKNKAIKVAIKTLEKLSKLQNYEDQDEDNRASLYELEDEKGLECEMCGKRKLSVKVRPDAYLNDVENDLEAEHTICDECDYQNTMDI